MYYFPWNKFIIIIIIIGGYAYFKKIFHTLHTYQLISCLIRYQQ